MWSEGDIFIHSPSPPPFQCVRLWSVLSTMFLWYHIYYPCVWDGYKGKNVDCVCESTSMVPGRGPLPVFWIPNTPYISLSSTLGGSSEGNISSLLNHNRLNCSRSRFILYQLVLYVLMEILPVTIKCDSHQKGHVWPHVLGNIWSKYYLSFVIVCGICCGVVIESLLLSNLYGNKITNLSASFSIKRKVWNFCTYLLNIVGREGRLWTGWSMIHVIGS